jgi:hypothetical protein
MDMGTSFGANSVLRCGVGCFGLAVDIISVFGVGRVLFP